MLNYPFKCNVLLALGGPSSVFNRYDKYVWLWTANQTHKELDLMVPRYRSRCNLVHMPRGNGSKTVEDAPEDMRDSSELQCSYPLF